MGPPIVLDWQTAGDFSDYGYWTVNQVQEHCTGELRYRNLEKTLALLRIDRIHLISRRYVQVLELDTLGQQPRPVAREEGGPMRGSDCTELNPLKIIHH